MTNPRRRGPRWRALRERLGERPGYPWIVFFVALTGLLSSNFLVSVLGAALGTLAEEFDVDSGVMRLVVSGPNLGFAVLAVTSGKLADLFGRRQAFIVALIGSGFFGALSAVAWSAETLIAFRTISAIFGSATGPAGIAIISGQFEAARRIKVLGWWGLVMAGGPVLGIAVGGPVIDAFSWRWLFVAQIPLTLMALVLAVVVLPDTPRRERVKFDVAGTVVLAASVTILMAAVNRGPAWGWGSPVIIGGFVVAVVLGAAFLAVEGRADAPLIPVDYFRRRNFAIPMVSVLFTNFSYMGAGFVLTPLFLDEVFGYSTTRIGFLVTSRPLFFALAGPVVGYLGQRLGERILATSGAALVVVSALGLSLVGAETSDLFIFTSLGFAGFGLGITMPAMTAAVTNAVDERDIATASGAQQMMWQLGTAIGIEVLGSVQKSRVGAVGLEHSYDHAFVVAASVAAVGMLLASFLRRTDSGSPPPAGEGARRGRGTANRI